MKTKTAILLSLSAMAFLAGCSREDASTAMQDARTAVGEFITPSSGKPDDMLVVRQAKLKERRRQNTTWTAENITAHPDLFLQQCMEDVNAAIGEYKAILFSLRTLFNENERKASEAEETVARLTRFIEEAKPYYADEGTVYPVTVSGFSFTREEFVEKLREAIKERSLAESFVAPARKRAKVAKIRIAQVEKAKELAEDALRSLKMSLEDVKASKALTGVKGIQDTVKEILDRANAIQDYDKIPLDTLGEPTDSDDAFIRKALGL